MTFLSLSSFVLLLATMLQISHGQFLQVNLFTSPDCAATASSGTTIFIGINVCGNTDGGSTYTKTTVVGSGSKAVAMNTNYLTSSCTGSGTWAGNVTIGGCQIFGGVPMTVSMVTTITAPSNAIADMYWTSQSTCTAGVITSGLYQAIYTARPATPALQCSGSNNNAPLKNYVCPGAVTSTNGGFMVLNYYASAGCAGMPLQTLAMQMGTCVNSTTGTSISSFKLFPWTNGKGMTQLNSTTYVGSPTCTTGSKVIVVNNPLTNTLFMNTTACKKVNGQVLAQQAPTGASYYTMSLSSSVGSSVVPFLASYTTAAGCVAATTSTIQYIVTVLPSTLFFCNAVSSGSSMFKITSVSSCPAVVNTPTTIYASTRFAVSAAVTLAAAQTAGGTFQTTFINAVANTLGVASSAVTITSVTSTTRRQLLQTGINVAYSVATITSAATTVQTLLASSATSVTSQMATTYPGISVSAPVTSVLAPSMTPSAAPSSAATPATTTTKSAASHVFPINAWLVMSVMSMVGIILFAM